MKHILWILLCPVLAFSQVTPTIPTGTVLGNSSGSTAAPGALTALPAGFLACTSAFTNNATPSAAGTCFYSSFNITGVQAATGPFAPFWTTANDSSDGSSNVSSSPDALRRTVYNLQEGFRANRNFLTDTFNVNGAPLYTDASSHAYVSNQIIAKIGSGASLGGVALNPADANGQLWGQDINVVSATGTSDLQSITGLEIDNNINTGVSVLNHYGIANNTSVNDSTRGTLTDCAYCISAGATANATWRVGIQFGLLPGGSKVFDTDSDLELLETRAYVNSYTAPVANTGIDFRKGNFTTAFIEGPNAGIDPVGNVSGASLSLISNTINVVNGGVATITPSAFAGVTGGAYYASASFPTLFISAPASGGIQAAAHVATMNLQTAQVLTPGTGCSNGDVLTLTGSITGTAPQVTLNIGTFSGSVTSNGSGNPLYGAGVNIPGSVTGSAIATGMLLTDAGSFVPALSYLVSGATTLWQLQWAIPIISSESMTATGATISTAGSVTAKSATITTTGGTCSVQPTFNFGFGIATTVIDTAGTLYPAFPLPVVVAVGGGANNTRSLPAKFGVTMSTTSTPYSPTLTGVTNGSAAAAGIVGEKAFVDCLNSQTSTATITIATPAVVTWTPPASFVANVTAWTCPVSFTTTGALPTGISTAATTFYWIIGSTYSAGSFQIADTAAHAIAGTNAVATSGTQSGTQTIQVGALFTTAASAAVVGITLAAGDWDCSGQANYTFTAALTTNGYSVAFGNSSTGLGTQDQTSSVRMASTTLANTASVSSPLLQESASISKTYYTVSNVGGMSGGTAVAGGTASCRRIR